MATLRTPGQNERRGGGASRLVPGCARLGMTDFRPLERAGIRYSSLRVLISIAEIHLYACCNRWHFALDEIMEKELLLPPSFGGAGLINQRIIVFTTVRSCWAHVSKNTSYHVIFTKIIIT